MGNGDWGLGNGESGIGNGESGMGDGDWRLGTGESGMGAGDWESGIMARLLDSLLLMNKPLSAVISSFGVRCSLICSNLRHPVSAGGAMRSKGGRILPGIL